MRSRLRTILVALIGLLVVLAALYIGALRDERQRETAEQWRDHTISVLRETRNLLSSIQQAESAQRLLLVTGEQEDAAQYRRAAAAVPYLIGHLAKLTADNPVQRENVAALRRAAADKLDMMTKLVRLVENGRSGEAVALARSGAGRQRMQAVQAVITRMTAEEERLLVERAATADRVHAGAQRLLWGALAAGLLLLALSGGLAMMSARAAAAAESATDLRERGRQQERVAVLGRDALTVTDFSVFARQAMLELQKTLGAKSALLLRWTEQGTLRVELALGLDDDTAAAITFAVQEAPLDAAPIVQRNNDDMPALAAAGVCSGLFASVPGVHGPLGMIAVFDKGTDLFSPNDLHFVLSIANLIAAAAQRDADRRALLDSLHRADAIYQAYFDNTAEALFVVGVDEDGGFRILAANPVYEATTGRSMAHSIGCSIEEWLPPTILEAVRANLRHCVDSGAPYRIEEALDVDGEKRVWDTVLVPVLDHAAGSGGRVFRIVGSGRDITDQRLAQDRLRHAQKMEALGQLTGGVAHDVNNLLTPIVGGLDLLRRRISDERGLRLIDAALTSAHRVQLLVQRMLGFARRQHLQPQPVDLAALIEGSRELIARSLGPQIQIALDIAADLPAAMVDPNQLELSLLNLSVNARDAMPDGGTLMIAIRPDTIVDGDIPGLGAGTYLRLSMVDTGIGMDAATLARASEPFFTTKPVGKGTGLGLSLVHGLAEQSGGRFLLSSRPGEGTRAELLLPATTGRPSARVDAEAGPEVAMPPLRILVVDDEDMVRATTAESLRELGHAVEEANSGPAALAYARTMGTIDLLVTDHMMPGMTGEQLAKQMRQSRPDLPVLLVTGYANLASPDAQKIDILLKPFRPAEFRRKISELFQCVA